MSPDDEGDGESEAGGTRDIYNFEWSKVLGMSERPTPAVTRICLSIHGGRSASAIYVGSCDPT